MQLKIKQILSSTLLLALMVLISGCSKASKVDSLLDDAEKDAKKMRVIAIQMQNGNQSGADNALKLLTDYTEKTTKAAAAEMTPAQAMRLNRIQQILN